MNKKGAEMTIGTIIAITLGVALLVFLIYGFSTQWNAFRGVLDPLASGDSNVDNIARGCEVACASNNVYDYCEKNRILKFGKDSGKPNAEGSCKELYEEGNLSVSCDIC
ncbi:hypothetical protein KAS08_03475 [Candidatus Pacearchaeota archaeon]|nr:hypothetical protein [Candidatus Pacearchaeota archaeon]